MGTDRDLIHEGPCSCGKGKYIVYFCTPDHPYAKEDQYSYEFKITCSECSQKYLLEVRGCKTVRILKSEVEKRRKIQQLFHNKGEQIMGYAKEKGYLQAVKERIGQLPSVASIYRALKLFLPVYQTEATFRKHFTDAGKWVDKNIFAHDIEGVMRFLGIKDKELTTMVDEMEKLRELSRQAAPVVEPAICDVPREGKTLLI